MFSIRHIISRWLDIPIPQNSIGKPAHPWGLQGYEGAGQESFNIFRTICIAHLKLIPSQKAVVGKVGKTSSFGGKISAEPGMDEDLGTVGHTKSLGQKAEGCARCGT